MQPKELVRSCILNNLKKLLFVISKCIEEKRRETANWGKVYCVPFPHKETHLGAKDMCLRKTTHQDWFMNHSPKHPNLWLSTAKACLCLTFSLQIAYMQIAEASHSLCSPIKKTKKVAIGMNVERKHKNQAEISTEKMKLHYKQDKNFSHFPLSRFVHSKSTSTIWWQLTRAKEWNFFCSEHCAVELS